MNPRENVKKETLNQSESLNDDWNLWVNTPESRTSDRASGLSKIRLSLFLKILFIHLVSAGVTLTFCPQFGIRVLGEGMGISHYFMQFGEEVCGLFCGGIFLSSSVILSVFFLSTGDWALLRSRKWIFVAALVLLSVGVFKIMNGEFFLSFTIAWILGALGLGVASIEGIYQLLGARTNRLP